MSKNRHKFCHQPNLIQPPPRSRTKVPCPCPLLAPHQDSSEETHEGHRLYSPPAMIYRSPCRVTSSTKLISSLHVVPTTVPPIAVACSGIAGINPILAAITAPAFQNHPKAITIAFPAAAGYSSGFAPTAGKTCRTRRSRRYRRRRRALVVSISMCCRRAYSWFRTTSFYSVVACTGEIGIGVDTTTMSTTSTPSLFTTTTTTTAGTLATRLLLVFSIPPADDGAALPSARLATFLCPSSMFCEWNGNTSISISISIWNGCVREGRPLVRIGWVCFCQFTWKTSAPRLLESDALPFAFRKESAQRGLRMPQPIIHQTFDPLSRRSLNNWRGSIMQYLIGHQKRGFASTKDDTILD